MTHLLAWVPHFYMFQGWNKKKAKNSLEGNFQGIHSRVDSKFSNKSGQDSGGVQVSECGGRGRICQVVSGHVDGLHGGDGSLLGGGDTLLHATHVGGKGWLVTQSRGDTAEKGRYFDTSLVKYNYFYSNYDTMCAPG